MTSAAPPTGTATGAPGRGRGLAALTPSGRAIVPLAWATYDFANTIFTFAVVSGAIGLWLTEPAQFGERDGNVLLSVAILVSVGLNAIVSPILGAISDRAGRRLPYLLFFTALCVIPTAFIGSTGAVVGLILFIVANFAYQAALIYYDATLRSVSYPETRGRLSGIGVAIGYMGTIFVGLSIFALEVAVRDAGRDALRSRRGAVRPVRDPDLPRREGDAAAGLPHADRARARRVVRPAPDDDRPRPPGARASGASCSAGSSTPTRSTRSSSS